MPFTPFHLGPGLLLKGLLQGSFSFMVYGWTQVLMDIQPLIVLITGEGHLHGFSHTLMGGGLIAVFAAISGKYASEWTLSFLQIPHDIRWWVSGFSAGLGALSHVILDAIMHGDLYLFFPFSDAQPLLGVLTISNLHKLCFYTGLVGLGIYSVGLFWQQQRKDHHL